MEGFFSENQELFIVNCLPILTPINRSVVTASSALCFTSVHSNEFKFEELCKWYSFIIIIIKELFMKNLFFFSGEKILGYNLETILFKKSLYDLIDIDNSIEKLCNYSLGKKILKLLSKNFSFL